MSLDDNNRSFFNVDIECVSYVQFGKQLSHLHSQIVDPVYRWRMQTRKWHQFLKIAFLTKIPDTTKGAYHRVAPGSKTKTVNWNLKKKIARVIPRKLANSVTGGDKFKWSRWVRRGVIMDYEWCLLDKWNPYATDHQSLLYVPKVVTIRSKRDNAWNLIIRERGEVWLMTARTLLIQYRHLAWQARRGRPERYLILTAQSKKRKRW